MTDQPPDDQPKTVAEQREEAHKQTGREWLERIKNQLQQGPGDNTRERTRRNTR